MFNPDAGNLGGKVGFVFGATTFIGFVGVYIWLPEPKGRTAADLDKLYASGISARNFHKVKIEDLE
jgi:SP family general alpha glucoside:H+ symporter-like MFS transporter